MRPRGTHIFGRRALGRGRIRPDSLIAVVNYGRMWGLRDYVCVMLLGFPLLGVLWFESPRHSQK
jgi:hypothetical protein